MEQPLPDRRNSSSFCPFSLKMEHLDCMINMEFVNHPVYTGIEIQGHNNLSSTLGKGLLVFLQRQHDNVTDVYYEPTLQLKASTKKLFSLGKGLGVWKEQSFDRAKLEVSPETGVRVDVLFRDVDGRTVHVQVDDDTPFDPAVRNGMTNGFLAPIGATIEHPTSIQLIYMKQLDLVRRTGREPVIEIDGEAVTIGRMPLEQCLWGTRLIKVAKDLVVVRVNPDTDPEEEESSSDFENIVERDAHGGVTSITAECRGNKATFSFEPAFPDPTHFDDNDEEGTWQVNIDDDRIISGTWTCDVNSTSSSSSSSQQQDTSKANIQLVVTRGWRPSGLPWMTAILFTIVPVFKTWPETYRWVASLQWSTDEAKRGPVVPDTLSHWERTSGDRGESYTLLSGGGRRK